jgi:hypothetical protein
MLRFRVVSLNRFQVVSMSVFSSQGHLETVIDSFEKFTELILLNLNSIKEGDEVPLAKIFGKQVRRLNGKLNQFENELIDKINLKLYDKLSLGKKDTYGNSSTQVQHFIKN